MLNNIFIRVFCLCLILFASFAFLANAETQYKLLAPLPQGTATVQADATGFSTYMTQLFWFLLSAAVILALVMIVIGGVEYVGSAGNTSLLGDAKGRILNALLGLLLAFSSWLILNLINPDLVDFGLPPVNLSAGSPTLPTNAHSTQPPLTPGSITN